MAHGVKVPSLGTERLVVRYISTYVMETAARKAEAGHASVNISNRRRETSSTSTEVF